MKAMENNTLTSIIYFKSLNLKKNITI